MAAQQVGGSPSDFLTVHALDQLLHDLHPLVAVSRHSGFASQDSQTGRHLAWMKVKAQQQIRHDRLKG